MHIGINVLAFIVSTRRILSTITWPFGTIGSAYLLQQLSLYALYLGSMEFLYVLLFYMGCAVLIIDMKCRLYINNFVESKPPFLLARSIFTFCDRSNGTIAKIFYPAIMKGKISGKFNVSHIKIMSASYV